MGEGVIRGQWVGNGSGEAQPLVRGYSNVEPSAPLLKLRRAANSSS
jgi:hypothetical protein